MPNSAVKDDQTEKRSEINKYSNRRFYDKTRSRHLTLEEIYASIRDGYEIKVTDSKTGNDITAKILAQIILELDPPKLDVFPVALLHRLLRTNEQLVTDFTQKYFSKALMAFLDSQKRTEQYVRQAMGLPSAGGSISDWTKLMLTPFDPQLWTVAQPTPPADQNPPPPAAATATADKMQQQIMQLQDELARIRQKRSPRTKRRKR